MYELTFQPYVGKRYENGGIFDQRITILGESHYGSVPDVHTTSKVLSKYLNENNPREGWMNTFLKFERSLVGRVTTHEDSKEIWESLLFYNYLQVLLSGPREYGTAQQYRDSIEAFFEVLNKYKPDVLIVWGKRLWQKLPWGNWTEESPLCIDGYDVDNGIYTLPDGHQVRTLCVYHPSAGYSWDYWFKVINIFVSL